MHHGLVAVRPLLHELAANDGNDAAVTRRTMQSPVGVPSNSPASDAE